MVLRLPTSLKSCLSLNPRELLAWKRYHKVKGTSLKRRSSSTGCPTWKWKFRLQRWPSTVYSCSSFCSLYQGEGSRSLTWFLTPQWRHSQCSSSQDSSTTMPTSAEARLMAQWRKTSQRCLLRKRLNVRRGLNHLWQSPGLKTSPENRVKRRPFQKYRHQKRVLPI